MTLAEEMALGPDPVVVGSDFSEIEMWALAVLEPQERHYYPLIEKGNRHERRAREAQYRRRKP